MSPSNSGRPVAVALAALAFAAIAAAGLAARDHPTIAILETGPEPRSGIDALAPDVTPHWYAAYRIGAALVELKYLGTPLPEADEWPEASCADRSLRSADGTLFYHRHPDGWSLLVAVSSGALPDGVTLCRFVDRFIVEHVIFEGLEGVRRTPGEPIFPAVVEW